jgi:ISXO2-like transposase domain/Transposase zinc-ribbon domain
MESDRPRAGIDYPGTWPSFEAWFPDDEACRSYLAQVRWPDGFECPACDGRDAWGTGRGLWMCRSCGRQTSVTAGTIFHRSRYPLRTWFAAMWFVCSQKNGVSALGLQRAFGFGSYETAWAWLHKLRRAMVRPDRELLGGDGVSVEVDQTFLGGRQKASSRRYGNKDEVVIGVERQHPKGFGRVRLAHIDTSNRKEELFGFAQHNLAHGTILYTDGDTIYPTIATKLQITHVPIVMVNAPEPAHVMLPGVHLVASLLQRWIAGTLQDSVSEQHLAYYLDEFTFRFNRRTSRSRGMLWYRLVQQAVNTDPHPLPVLQHKI